jgi:hypothetical protein
MMEPVISAAKPSSSMREPLKIQVSRSGGVLRSSMFWMKSERGTFLTFVAVFPLAADGEAVGSGSGGLGVFVPVGTLFLGIEFVEDALGGGLVIGEQKSELDLNGLHRGLEDGLVDFFAGVVAEGVLDGQLLMQDAAGDAQLTRGGGDLDAIEVKHAGRDLFEELLGVFELGLASVWAQQHPEPPR